MPQLELEMRILHFVFTSQPGPWFLCGDWLVTKVGNLHEQQDWLVGVKRDEFPRGNAKGGHTSNK